MDDMIGAMKCVLMSWSSGKDCAWALLLLKSEFHSCVYAGPMFRNPLSLSAGEFVNRDGFVYADFY